MSSGLRDNIPGNSNGKGGGEGGLFSEFAYKPEKGGATATASTSAVAGAPGSGTATAMGDGEGTSSGSEDTAWFEKPTKSNGGGGGGAAGGGVADAGKPKVLPAAALVKTGESGLAENRMRTCLLGVRSLYGAVDVMNPAVLRFGCSAGGRSSWWCVAFCVLGADLLLVAGRKRSFVVEVSRWRTSSSLALLRVPSAVLRGIGV